jgi:dipeptidyl-peptidase 4
MSYPVALAQTQRFTLGRPVQFTVSPDGARVVFLRTRGGRDPVRCLWVLEVATGEERMVADPVALAGGDLSVPAAERAQRERRRDMSRGISSYATDADVRLAVFTVSGRVFVADLLTCASRALTTPSPALDPRLDPMGAAVAYVHNGALRLASLRSGEDKALVEPDGDDVTWGLPEHVASESMHRMRGYWWSPDGTRLAVARVDASAVQTWYLFNPAEPSTAPIAMKYPMAGTPNAEVTLWLIDPATGKRTEVQWDRAQFEYLVTAVWDRHGLMIVVQNRPQTVMQILSVDPTSGVSTVEREDTDGDWLSIIRGVPVRTEAGELVTTIDDGDTRRLLVGGETVTPPGLQVHEVHGVDGGTVLFGASEEPAESHVWQWSRDAGLRQLTTEPGIHDGFAGGNTMVISSYTLAESDGPVTVTAAGRTHRIGSLAERPSVEPRVDLFKAGPSELRTAVLLPTGYERGGGKLPVLLDPYAGPAAQRAISAQYSYRASQWYADQGFLVIVADGRGTPNRSPRFERTIAGTNSHLALDDQIEALHAVAERYPEADLSRVAIRGWSFSGYLAAMAVLRRPDVFHAAVAGAPVTDKLYYDTHWQERYLGHPDTTPEAYAAGSLIEDAPNLRRPLMLIHGLMDDNVHPVHTIRLSAALFAAGRPHTVLPLPTASHMNSSDVAAQLMEIQAAFLKDALTPVREIG